MPVYGNHPGDRCYQAEFADSDCYDEASGRFISVDPVLDAGIPAQFNAYSYAWNNPVTRSDPTGLAPLGSGDTGCHSCSGKSHGKGVGGGQPGAGAVSGTNQQKANEIGDSLFGQLAAQYPIGGVRDENGILYTTAVPLQLIGGYTDAYDEAFRLVADMEEGKFVFEYEGNSYAIWAWKGDYPSWGAGNEVGFYWQEGPLEDAGERWHADPNVPGLPLMSVTLTSMSGWKLPGGGKIASFAPGEPQVWVGTWNTNVQDSRSSDLRIEATVAFTDPDMYEAFRDSLRGTDNNTWSFTKDGSLTATLRFRRRKWVR